MNDKCCSIYGSMENLQTHHWLYGDKAVEKKWTIPICVKCHQKIHRGHGVGRGEGYSGYVNNPERILKTFEAVLRDPGIPTFKLAEEVGISERTISKLRMKWGLDKKKLVLMGRSELEKSVVGRLYRILEEDIQYKLRAAHTNKIMALHDPQMRKIAKRCGGSLCIVITMEEREIYGISEGDILEVDLAKVHTNQRVDVTGLANCEGGKLN